MEKLCLLPHEIIIDRKPNPGGLTIIRGLDGKEAGKIPPGWSDEDIREAISLVCQAYNRGFQDGQAGKKWVAPRSVCRYCGKEVLLKKDGTFRNHYLHGRYGRSMVCHGTDLNPVNEPDTIAIAESA